MQTRPLGPGLPAVSTIGFGAMPLSIQGRPEEQVALRVIDAVLDAGVTFIDTANVYCLDNRDIGHNEHLIAKALKRRQGSNGSPLVATKGGLTRPRGRWESDGRPDRLKRACEQSLKALGVDCIDLYQLHAPDPRVPFTDSVGALADLQHEGKIRSVGLSNVSLDEIKEAQAVVTVMTVQNRLNPFFREALSDGVVRYCRENGIGFIAYSPLGGGQFNKTLSEHAVVRPIAQCHHQSPHAVVLAWLLAQAPNIIPVPGARSVEHALDSLRAVELKLDEEELEAITESGF
ncbi:MAG: aldo/keto reductase [Acidiferrobacterales bacterium]